MAPYDKRLHPGNVFACKYLIEQNLGEGAMGTVLAAEDITSGAKVALKCLLPDHHDDPGIVARFRREARATLRLRSEHVARVLDHGEAPGEGGGPPMHYLVMERLQGTDLREQLRTQGRISVGRAAEYVSQACVGLAEAHALGIVHRDIKPANLFCTARPDGSVLVKVLDFGIAKFESPNASGDRLEMTEHASSMGSLWYMAPEQVLDARSVDGRADIWSLGVVLYQLVSGQRPFHGHELADIAFAILTGTPRPFAEAAPHAPAGFGEVVMRCLAKKREDRWPNMVELARALSPFALRHASSPRAQLALRTAELSPADARAAILAADVHLATRAADTTAIRATDAHLTTRAADTTAIRATDARAALDDADGPPTRRMAS
jgi:serine/threonine-protein kinase